MRKIAFGRRRTEKVQGTRNDYHLVKKDDYILVEGLHEAIVTEEVWEMAQIKADSQSNKYKRINWGKNEKIHLLSGIVKCPVCGVGMYGNKTIKRRKDSSKINEYNFYGCKHRNMARGHKCDFSKQINEEILNEAVAEVIKKLVSNKKFADLMKQKINTEIDTSEIDKEISSLEKQIRQLYAKKESVLKDLDSLDYEDAHYQRIKTDYENILYKTYDKIDEKEELLIEARAKKRAILADKISAENIYKAILFFDKLYEKMSDEEKREFYEKLIYAVHVYEERQHSGQWLKSIEFRLPIIDHDMKIGLNNGESFETVVRIQRRDT